MHNTIVEYNDDIITYKSIEGYYITNYDTSDNVENYYGTRMICCSGNINISNFYTITEEQHNLYEKEKEKIRLEIEEKVRNHEI